MLLPTITFMILQYLSITNGQFVCDPSQGCVQLSTVNVLTFSQNQYSMTSTGLTYPQLSCTGGNACNEVSQVQSVQCTNSGVDDTGTVNWKCQSQLPAKLTFGYTNPACQGFRYPGDSQYIRKGSCKLLFSLNDSTYRAPATSTSTSSSIGSSIMGVFQFIGLMLFLVVISIFCCCRGIWYSCCGCGTHDHYIHVNRSDNHIIEMSAMPAAVVTGVETSCSPTPYFQPSTAYVQSPVYRQPVVVQQQPYFAAPPYNPGYYGGGVGINVTEYQFGGGSSGHHSHHSGGGSSGRHGGGQTTTATGYGTSTNF